MVLQTVILLMPLGVEFLLLWSLMAITVLSVGYGLARLAYWWFER